MFRFIWLLLIICSCSVYSADFMGASSCQSCHQEEYDEWLKSDHFKSLDKATPETVLGDFSGQQLSFHGMPFKPYRKGDEFWVDSIDKKGELKSYKVDYVFAYDPLQTYGIDIGDGHIQIHNVAWDNNPKEEGGQRWFHLQPTEKMSHDHPFFWQGAYQNMNSRCAECHTTEYQKNYNEETNSYNTTWTDINVACESCHGPGSEHVKLAEAEKLTTDNSGFALKMASGVSWHWEPGAIHASPKGKPTNDYINMCGACHSRRISNGPLQSDPSKDYHEQFRLVNLQDSLYFPDGQIKDEVFVIGSFTQSKMHAAGVTCNDCHNVHTGKVKTTENALCAQCHMPTEFDTPEHHGHERGTEGSQCITCHMPDRKYMVVDPRRDHSFKSPRPELTDKLGAPNVCQRCHEDKSNDWAASEIAKWPKGKSAGHPTWPFANAKGNALKAEAEKMLLKEIRDPELPATIKSSLYDVMAPYGSPGALAQAKSDLDHESVQVRRAALETFRGQPPEMIWQNVLPMLNDKSIQVRSSAFSLLVATYPQAPEEIKKRIEKGYPALLETIENSMDMPSSQVSIAQWELAKGNVDAAIKRYERSLRIDPYFIPAIVNLADIYRGRNEHEKEKQYWETALKIVPENASVQHGYGLMLVRQKQYAQALQHLKEAATVESAIPHYALVYAVALTHQGQMPKAIDALKQANKRWPRQYDVLTTLVNYLEQGGQTQALLNPLMQLIQIAPNSPQVQYWKQKYIK